MPNVANRESRKVVTRYQTRADTLRLIVFVSLNRCLRQLRSVLGAST
jgi:hypothetical protein